jgi:hypothetical protein
MNSDERRARGMFGAVCLIAILGIANATESPSTATRSWPHERRAAALDMIARYGRPGQYDRESMVWFNKGDWKRIIVRRRAAGGRFIEEAIGYLVPSSKIGDLKRFSPALEVSATAGELIFRSDSEKKNRLALNLADQVVTGKLTPEAARAEYVRTLKLTRSGKSSPSVERLLFDVDNQRHMTPTGADK